MRGWRILEDVRDLVHGQLLGRERGEDPHAGRVGEEPQEFLHVHS